jgi:hypothetical protein
MRQSLWKRGGPPDRMPVSVGPHMGPVVLPRFGRRSSERRRVPLRVKQIAIGVVVDLNKVRPPGDPHGLGHMEDRLDRSLQAVGPAFDGPSGVAVQSCSRMSRAASLLPPGQAISPR